jgi:hypothetical protein
MQKTTTNEETEGGGLCCNSSFIVEYPINITLLVLNNIL